MCGRFVQSMEERRLAGMFPINWDDEMERILHHGGPRYNIAPSQIVPLFRLHHETAKPELASLKWGLLPFWSKGSNARYSTINAVSETAATKPAFRASFKKRRCIVPISGFYEWKPQDRRPP